VRAELATEILSDFAALEAMAADWERLWQLDPQRHVFLSFPWARAWWRAHGPQHRLAVAVVREERTTIGILPMVREGAVLHFLGSPDADYTDLLCEEARRVEVVAAALKALLDAREWTNCRIDNLPENSRIARSLDQLPAPLRARLRLLFKASCPAIVADGADGAIFRTLARKESIRRHDRKLERLGVVRLRDLQTPAEIHEHLPVFVRQHIARRAMAGDRSLLLAPEAVAFYRALAEELDPRRDLRFSVLETGGTPLAYHLGFETAGKFIWYKPTFDIDRWDWSPGEVLLGRLLRDAGDRALAEFDFTLGDEAFKYRFANEVRRLFVLRLYPSGLRGYLQRFRDACKLAVKSQPRIRALLLRMAAWLREHGAQIRRLPAALRRAASRDDFLVFRYPLSQTDLSHESCPSAVLSDLALLAPHYPHWLTPDYLREARTRLREGARCYIGLNAECLVSIAWVADRASLAVGRSELTLPRPAAVIFDWTAASSAAAQAMLQRIAEGEANRGADLWARCRRSDKDFRSAADACGFREVGVARSRHNLCEA
jgi:CelD/BcsL family acetyltransferase involved in cellulose biosynthesis